MANVVNPRKRFNFSIQIVPDPINPFLFQKVTTPDIDVEPVAHGDTNHDIKTAGRVMYGNVVAEKLMVSDEADNYIWGWIDSIQSSVLGGGTPPGLYKKTIIVTELAEDGATVINTHTYLGAWPVKINGLELDRVNSENTIETIEFSVDKIAKV